MQIESMPQQALFGFINVCNMCANASQDIRKKENDKSHMKNYED